MAFASACSGNEKPNATNEVRLSGFEDYYEMQKINYGIFVGGMSLNNDKAYVCEGEMSGKLYIDYAEKEPVDYNDNDGGKAYGDTTKPQFGFLPSLYDTAVGDLGIAGVVSSGRLGADSLSKVRLALPFALAARIADGIRFAAFGRKHAYDALRQSKENAP